jgi:hypothetical protein
MSLFLKYARATDLYRALCRVPASAEGNLLGSTDDTTAEAQVEFLRWALLQAAPRVVLETGTHQGHFGYLLSLVARGVTLHTCDVNPHAAQAVTLLNAGQANMACVLHEGDSRVTLPALDVPAQFAWIDGGHDTPVAVSDLIQCQRLRIPYVALDDTAYPPVQAALAHCLRHTAYTLVPNPFADHDQRKAVLLRLDGLPEGGRNRA